MHRPVGAGAQGRARRPAAGGRRLRGRHRRAPAGAVCRRGIGPERLDLRPRLPTRDYLALHNEIDLLLDTFPYAGGTTSNHALWMGVPTLTLAGRTLAQRLGAGIMGKVGLSDWVAESEDEFVAIAQRAAAHPDELARLRQSLRGRLMHSPT
jgi:predicted O-linked N-acetylglucosamine transferase (SPINDLY family)